MKIQLASLTYYNEIDNMNDYFAWYCPLSEVPGMPLYPILTSSYFDCKIDSEQLPNFNLDASKYEFGIAETDKVAYLVCNRMLTKEEIQKYGPFCECMACKSSWWRRLFICRCCCHCILSDFGNPVDPKTLSRIKSKYDATPMGMLENEILLLNQKITNLYALIDSKTR